MHCSWLLPVGNLRKRQLRISNAEAERRILAMLPFIREDVQLALAIRAALEGANETLASVKDSGRRFWGANCYNIIVQSLAHELAIVLSRLFDLGAKRRHPNKKDIASIPLLLRFLRQKRCQRFLMGQTHSWFPDAPGAAQCFPDRCANAIANAGRIYREAKATSKVRRALRDLKQFRDKRLAHNIIDTPDDARPTYDGLYLLTDLACEVLAPTIFAIDGSQYRFTAIEEHWKSEADRFWRRAFAGLGGSNGATRSMPSPARRP